MCAFYNGAGSHLTKTQVLALTQTPAVADPPLQFTAPVYQTYSEDNSSQDFEELNRLMWAAGEIVPTSVINGAFVLATIASITPNAGAAAGGTNIVIKGTDFGGTTGVTIGAVACTNVKVVDSHTITATSPAKTAGTYDVVVQDDAGNVTATAAFTTS